MQISGVSLFFAYCRIIVSYIYEISAVNGKRVLFDSTFAKLSSNINNKLCFIRLKRTCLQRKEYLTPGLKHALRFRVRQEKDI